MESDLSFFSKFAVVGVIALFINFALFFGGISFLFKLIKYFFLQ